MMKSEKGSITVFTLSACLLMVFILVGIFMGSQNKIINQKKQLQTIEERYNDNNEKDTMAKMYEEALEKDISNIKADLKISTSAELKDFATRVNNGETFEGKTIVLMNDIDMSSVCSDSLGSWTPIGTETNTFKGTFNGRNYTISNLYIKAKDSNQGLFGVNNGIIKNLKMNNGSIVVNYYAIENYGIIAANNYGEILSCKILDGKIGSSATPVSTTGGICGYNEGKVSKCYNNAVNSVMQITGGIAGYNKGIIELCYNGGTIGNYSVNGGIAGKNGSSGIIRNCYNIGKISTNCPDVGGIVGTNESSGIIENCYSVGDVTTNTEQPNLNGGADTPNAGGGAIIGNSNSEKVKNCYYLEGIAKGGIGNSFSAATDIVGVAEVKTEEELKELASTLGNAFRGDYAIRVNNGYPILSWQ